MVSLSVPRTKLSMTALQRLVCESAGQLEAEAPAPNGTAVSNPFKLTMLCFSNFCSVSIAWVVHERIVLSSPLEETGF